jgi:hypothetical protein
VNKQDDMIARVCGNGPFETAEVARVQALAQLGARVLEILHGTKERNIFQGEHAQALEECAAAGVSPKLSCADAEGVAEILRAFDRLNGTARSLGLLGEKGGA